MEHAVASIRNKALFVAIKHIDVMREQKANRRFVGVCEKSMNERV